MMSEEILSSQNPKNGGSSQELEEKSNPSIPQGTSTFSTTFTPTSNVMGASSEPIPVADNSTVEHGKQRSVVWNHFTKKKVNGMDKAECNYCHKLLGGSSKHGTNHLHQHMKSCPKRSTKDIRQMMLSTDVKGDIANHAFDQANARRDLASMIIVHEYPLSMVDHDLFKKFLNTLQPLFKCPSRNTIKSDIFKIYDFERNKMMKILENNTSRVAITTDMWTASTQKKGFMAVTAHFIDNSWTLQSQLLRYRTL